MTSRHPVGKRQRVPTRNPTFGPFRPIDFLSWSSRHVKTRQAVPKAYKGTIRIQGSRRRRLNLPASPCRPAFTLFKRISFRLIPFDNTTSATSEPSGIPAIAQLLGFHSTDEIFNQLLASPLPSMSYLPNHSGDHEKVHAIDVEGSRLEARLRLPTSDASLIGVCDCRFRVS